MLRRDLIYTWVVLIFNIITLICLPFQASNASHAGKGKYITVTPSTFPLLTIILILILCIMLITTIYRKKKMEMPETSEAAEEIEISPVITVFLAVLLYAFLLNILGFVIDTILLCTFITLFYRGRLWQVLVAGIISPLFIYYLFKMLYVPLPKGFWA